MDDAVLANVWFLGAVASLRVAWLFFYLRRMGGLGFGAIVAGALLPLAVIVNTLSFLNLERAVFDIMGGLDREGTPNDGAYMLLLTVTALSWYAAIPLFLVYTVVVSKALYEKDRSSEVALPKEDV